MRILVSHHVSLEEVRQRLLDLVARMSRGGDGEHVVELLQRPLHRLRNKQKDHHESDQVQPSVEAERARRSKHGQHPRERDGEHAGPSQAGRHRPRHAHLSMSQREHCMQFRVIVQSGQSVDLLSLVRQMPPENSLSPSAEYVNGTGPSPGL